MSTFGRLVLAATHNPVSRNVITRTPVGMAVARRFVAGERLEEAVAVSRRMNESGKSVSLDLLGEEVTSAGMVEEAIQGYGQALDAIGEEGLDANISVKLTQLGLAFDPERAVSALDTLAVTALDHGTTVTVDMEDSRFTDATLDVYQQVQERRGNLGVAIQAMLHRSPADLERIIPLGGHVRLCKGAYAEPPERALQDREEIRRAYVALLEQLMGAPGVRPAIATHDDVLIERGLALAAGRDGNYEFQMLYGVRPSLQDEIVGGGQPLRVYVPFGSHWYPYLTRRLAERPGNLWFFARALVGR